MKLFYLLIPFCFLVANPALAQETSNEEPTEKVESETPEKAPKKGDAAKKETGSEAKKDGVKKKKEEEGTESTEEAPAPTQAEDEAAPKAEAAPEHLKDFINRVEILEPGQLLEQWHTAGRYRELNVTLHLVLHLSCLLEG